MIAAAMWVAKLLARDQPAHAPAPVAIDTVTVGDRLVASALPCCTWTVVRVRESGGERTVSLKWGDALIVRDEAQLRSSNEEWRRA